MSCKEWIKPVSHLVQLGAAIIRLIAQALRVVFRVNSYY
jgi:hypothetical protein